VAVFGRKDAQQAAMVRRLVRDLDLAVEVDVRPTVREPDGLAMSSRNALLGPADRERARAIPRALKAVADAADRGVEAALAAGRAELAGLEVDYLAAVDADTLRPVESFGEGDVLVAVAARVGGVRLIDNETVRAGDRAHGETKRGIPCNA
jgi:pantoate--beta-alanine ligase